MSELQNITFVEEIIRDGSYASDFKFDPAELRELLGRLDELSFVDVIDIGPGTGLGTRTPTPEPSVDQHLQIAADTITDTDLMTLILPSVADESAIDLLASHADTLDIVRVGVNADDVSTATKLLERCEDLDFTTALSLLKTYLISPRKAVSAADMAAEYGADVVYVVDSAGGLVPHEVMTYVTRLREQTDLEVGFHGHNNLGCGLQNAIAAIEAGATHVDASLQGIGRSAGNVQTELVCIHSETELPRDDWRRLFEIETLLEDVYPGERGVSVQDVLYGLAQFHSSFEPDLREFADEQNEPFFDILLFAAENELATMQGIREAYPPDQ